MRITYLFVLLIFGLSLQGQNTLRGRVLDAANDQPLPSANIRIKGTTAGTSTSSDGTFELEAARLPVVLQVSFLGYQSNTVTISNSSEKLRIYLNSETTQLPETEIYASKVKDLIKEKPLYVYDYEFLGDSLLLLTFPHCKTRKATLILMNKNGDELIRQAVKNPEALYPDKLGNVHLFTKDSTYQLFAGGGKIHLLYPAAKRDFLERIASLCGHIGSNYYVRSYRHKNQVLDYFRYDYQKNKSHHFKTISSEQGVNMLYLDFYWRIQQKDFSEADLRFEEMAFYSPIFAPMVTLKDTVVILNYLHDSLQIYNPEGKKIRSKQLSFHHNKNWEEKLITDKATSKVYALFSDRGIQYLREINLNTGLPGRIIDIPDFRFVEEIKVHKNTMYFLYKDFQGQRYKKLYKMSLAEENA